MPPAAEAERTPAVPKGAPITMHRDGGRLQPPTPPSHEEETAVPLRGAPPDIARGDERRSPRHGARAPDLMMKGVRPAAEVAADGVRPSCASDYDSAGHRGSWSPRAVKPATVWIRASPPSGSDELSPNAVKLIHGGTRKDSVSPPLADRRARRDRCLAPPTPPPAVALQTTAPLAAVEEKPQRGTARKKATQQPVLPRNLRGHEFQGALQPPPKSTARDSSGRSGSPVPFQERCVAAAYRIRPFSRSERPPWREAVCSYPLLSRLPSPATPGSPPQRRFPTAIFECDLSHPPTGGADEAAAELLLMLSDDGGDDVASDGCASDVHRLAPPVFKDLPRMPTLPLQRIRQGNPPRAESAQDGGRQQIEATSTSTTDSSSGSEREPAAVEARHDRRRPDPLPTTAINHRARALPSRNNRIQPSGHTTTSSSESPHSSDTSSSESSHSSPRDLRARRRRRQRRSVSFSSPISVVTESRSIPPPPLRGRGGPTTSRTEGQSRAIKQQAYRPVPLGQRDPNAVTAVSRNAVVTTSSSLPNGPTCAPRSEHSRLPRSPRLGRSRSRSHSGGRAVASIKSRGQEAEATKLPWEPIPLPPSSARQRRIATTTTTTTSESKTTASARPYQDDGGSVNPSRGTSASSTALLGRFQPLSTSAPTWPTEVASSRSTTRSKRKVRRHIRRNSSSGSSSSDDSRRRSWFSCFLCH